MSLIEICEICAKQTHSTATPYECGGFNKADGKSYIESNRKNNNG